MVFAYGEKPRQSMVAEMTSKAIIHFAGDKRQLMADCQEYFCETMLESMANHSPAPELANHKLFQLENGLMVAQVMTVTPKQN